MGETTEINPKTEDLIGAGYAIGKIAELSSTHRRNRTSRRKDLRINIVERLAQNSIKIASALMKSTNNTSMSAKETTLTRI